jgi:hypothetical protein
VHEFVGAYITAKWFKGSITISSADTDVTDMDTYQVSFEQINDSADITLKTFDITAAATNNAAWLYAYLYTLHVTGDKCNVDTESTIDLPAAEVTAGMTYRLRRGEINESFSGATDGFWVDMFPGPLASTYWENINVKVWVEVGTSGSTTGDPEPPVEDDLPDVISWEGDDVGQPPTETPMYSSEVSTVRAIDGVCGTLSHMVETITSSGNHIHNWRSPAQYDISNGIRVEACIKMDTPESNSDFYVGLSPNFTADATFTGLPDYCVHTLFRDDDNDVYQRYSLSGIDDWNDVDQLDLGINMLPYVWGHFQFEYIPDEDEIKAQWRNIATDSGGGFKTLALTISWGKPSHAYVHFGGLNNSSSLIHVGRVWVGALTDEWPYYGSP